ncbi:MAG: pyridoxamine 5'-phosphate oxidase [Taibaiella sp.]|nr:pyridoxamine 5'-phosphate oxidase [Taibaiella sp.]
MKDIADIRNEYQLAALDEATVGDDPIAFFTQWFIEAQKAEVDEVNAMALATCSPENIPHTRIVLLKGLEEDEFVFYTNYNSSKGKDIEHNPNVSLLFFWKELERQVRIQGIAAKIPIEKSEEYFHSRPTGSQVGAWASAQSTIIPDRNTLDDNYSRLEQEYMGKRIPRPEHWGGYAVKPVSIEFWQGRISRLHDRILFTRQQETAWTKVRLAP